MLKIRRRTRHQHRERPLRRRSACPSHASMCSDADAEPSTRSTGASLWPTRFCFLCCDGHLQSGFSYSLQKRAEVLTACSTAVPEVAWAAPASLYTSSFILW